MQRLGHANTLPRSSSNNAAATSHATLHRTDRTDRVAHMRERAVLSTLTHDRADLLQQLHSHLGSRAFADTLQGMNAERQVKALQLLSTSRRAAVFRELTQAQREIWHQACKAEALRDASLRHKLLVQLRTQWQRLRKNNGKSQA